MEPFERLGFIGQGGFFGEATILTPPQHRTGKAFVKYFAFRSNQFVVPHDVNTYSAQADRMRQCE
eukprot:SAG31_NODE_156_length_22055_cov_105.227728_10_plen_65_part_00